MLTVDERRVLHCARCGCDFDSRLSRYGFLLLGRRGRDRGPAPPDVRAVLCNPCASELAEDLGLFLLGGDLDAFTKGVITCGRSLRDRVAAKPAGAADELPGRAARNRAGLRADGLPYRVGEVLPGVVRRAGGGGVQDGSGGSGPGAGPES